MDVLRIGCTTSLLLFILFSHFWNGSNAITASDFYLIGSAERTLPQGDDTTTTTITLDPSFPYFGTNYDDIYVSTNGLISIHQRESSFTPRKFPTNNILIAPFWGDVDTTAGAGTITYGVTRNRTRLTRATEQIREAFPDQASFNPSYLFVATWDSVGYYNRKTNLLNTFQCVLITDGMHSFVIFLYPTDGIQWTAGDQQGNNGHMDPNSADSFAAIVGFNLNSMLSISLMHSGTDAISYLAQSSNVNNTGVWVFEVDELEITGPDPCRRLNPCDVNADCAREGPTSLESTCTCREPFTDGDGFTCSVPNPCLSMPCDINENCTGEGSNFTCTCRVPFSDGDGFSCSVPDPCLSNPCDTNAICIRDGLLNQDFMCTCTEPFTEGDGFNCSIPDPCLSEPCDVNAICSREGLQSPNFMCTCTEPFSDGDGFSCSVPDPCFSSPCDANANCTRDGFLSSEFTCTCREPFTDGDGFSCTVPDPCLPKPCDINADCTREGLLSSEFTCTCREPYTSGDGFICTVPDPCQLTPCDVNANCTREGLLSSEFTCTCREPFNDGDGFNCSVSDPCLSNPCDMDAECVREDMNTSTYTCMCLDSLETGNCTATVGDGDFSQAEVIGISIGISVGALILLLCVGALCGYIQVLGMIKRERKKLMRHKKPITNDKLPD